MYFPWTIEQFFSKVNSQFPVLLITGPQQVGKTTFLVEQKSKERTFVSLDDPLLCNLVELARDADIAPNTAKKWLSILQASGIVYLLEPYFTNVTKRLVKRPKLYFIDTGLDDLKK